MRSFAVTVGRNVPATCRVAYHLRDALVTNMREEINLSVFERAPKWFTQAVKTRVSLWTWEAVELAFTNRFATTGCPLVLGHPSL